MPARADVRQTVLACLNEFLESTGRTGQSISDRAHLINDIGLASDEGVDFVLDLCKVFEFEFPKEFNPFVHSNGRRGRRVGEMINAVASHLSTQESKR